MEEKALEQMIKHTIIIDQVFRDKTAVLETLRKRDSSSIIPIPNMEIEDSAWDNSKTIEKVTISLKENSYQIHVRPEEIEKAKLPQTVEMYNLHGWKEM